MTDHADALTPDWTIDTKSRKANSSRAYLAAVRDVKEILDNHRLASDTEMTARVIVSRLAHVHKLAPNVCNHDGAMLIILAHDAEVRRQERERAISDPLQELCERINHAIGPYDFGRCVPLRASADPGEGAHAKKGPAL